MATQYVVLIQERVNSTKIALKWRSMKVSIWRLRELNVQREGAEKSAQKK